MKWLNVINLGILVGAVTAQNSFGFTGRETEALSEFLGGAQINYDLVAAEQAGKVDTEMSKDTQPWAGYFWPDGLGGVDRPYRDPAFPQSDIRLIGPDAGFDRTLFWLKNHRGDALTADVYKLSDEELNNLSPAEKYDLLFSNTDFTLSHAIINDILYRVKTGPHHQHLVAWVGICNGWTLASLNVERPVDAIKVKSFSGRDITFYPHDLTALMSILYARSPINNWNYFLRDSTTFARTPVQTSGDPSKVPGAIWEPVFLRFLGQRCERDGSGCGSLNPALFHLALVNSIGYQNSGFVMDRHKGIAIGNVAVFGYAEKFYNPTNGKFGKASESISTDGLTDEEKQKGAAAKVGVVLTVKFRKELEPNTLNDEKITHYWDFEGSKEQTYTYSLLLDSKHNVIDGEWQKRWPGIGARNEIITNYPSFVWKLPTKTYAFSGNEGSLVGTDWNVQSPLPQTWRTAGEESAKLFQPLGVVIYNMINESRKSGRHL